LVCAAVTGIGLYDSQPHLNSATVPTALFVGAASDSKLKPNAPVPYPVSAAVEEASLLAHKLSETEGLRQALQAKRNEILHVKQDYQYGILELEDETKRLMKQGRIDSVALALKNQEIELLLQNTQRRLAYSEALEKPLQWINGASEELLYLQRRASIDLQMKNIAEGIDIKRHLSEIDYALERYQPTLGRLSVDTISAKPPSLEAICKRLLEQSKSMVMAPGDHRNQEIVAELCSGNLTRASELSKLSLKGARCLAESDAKQLFLNRLAEMPPPAAKKLSEWPGQWLCLNGFSRLDSDVASHLFEWQGQWISLNGLSEISAEAGKHMARWNGRQLELMGLRKPTGLEYLVQWEAAGGRLFVPDDIRWGIDSAGAGRRGGP